MGKTGCRFLAVLVGVALLAACSPAGYDFDSRELNDNKAKIRAVAEMADFVFVGTVAGLDPPPAYWSGTVAVFQGVTYNVDKVLKGFHSDPTADVLHPVVAASRTADATPGLSQVLFAPGSKLIVFASPANEFDLKSVNEDFGVIQHSDQNERAVLFSM